MHSSDWDFFMPGTAIETTPLEKAAARIAGMMQDTVTCPQVDCTGSNYAEFSLHVVCGATSADSVQLELGQYLLSMGEKLIRHAYFDQGEKYGRNAAAYQR
jgi:hypothetical protein